MNTNANKLVKISLLTAMSLILRYIEFPILPLFPWLLMDFSDIPALLAAFGIGPLAGIIIELLKNILILVVKGTNSGLIGEFGNFLVGVALILPASLLYHRNKSKKSAVLGMLLSGIFMEVAAIIINIYVLLPAYGMHMSTTESLKYITVGLLPFNGLKALLVSILTYLIYKKTSVLIFNDSPFSTKV